MNPLQFGKGEKHKLNVLESLEIPLWIERQKCPHLFLIKPRAYARVWVILSKQVKSSELEAYTIYKGMLKVLEISEAEFSYAIMKNSANNITGNIADNTLDNIVDNDDLIKMIDTLKRFSPENILILGKQKQVDAKWKKMLDSSVNRDLSIFSTYHPEELLASPHLKKEAYHCLLSLKQALHRGEVRA